MSNHFHLVVEAPDANLIAGMKWVLGTYTKRFNGKWHYGKELRESAEAKAERLIRETCRSDAVHDELLRRWRKGHPFKVRLALKLRDQTTVTVGWIAGRLQMGTREHAAHLLCRARKHGADPDQPTLSL